MITSFQASDGSQTPLSNFYAQPVQVEGVVYPTAEHAFQAMKSLDLRVRQEVAAIETPGAAKRFGRQMALRSDWEAVKLGVMRTVLAQKFAHPDAAIFLLGTGDQFLIEGNHWGDRFWGQCPVGFGENWLGFLLMGIRAGLRAA